MTVCSYHITYEFQNESTLYICLNVKELLARNRYDIWSLNDCNGTRTHNHLVRKRTLKYLAKLAKMYYELTVFVYELSGCRFESCCIEVIICNNCIWLLFLNWFGNSHVFLDVAFDEKSTLQRVDASNQLWKLMNLPYKEWMYQINCES